VRRVSIAAAMAESVGTGGNLAAEWLSW